MKAFEEIAEFLARRDPQGVIAFRLSPQALRRANKLVRLAKAGKPAPNDDAEFRTYLVAERIIRLAMEYAKGLLSRKD